MTRDDHQTADDTSMESSIIPTVPERKAGDFNSTGNTGIEVNLELQFGTDLKSEKLMRDFLSRFEKLKDTQSKVS